MLKQKKPLMAGCQLVGGVGVMLLFTNIL